MMEEQQKITQKQQELNQTNENLEPEVEDIFTNIKSQSKNIIIIVILSFIFNLDIANDIIKSLNVSFLLSETGEVNIQGALLKSILIGISYYVINFFMKE